MNIYLLAKPEAASDLVAEIVEASLEAHEQTKAVVALHGTRRLRREFERISLEEARNHGLALADFQAAQR